MNSWPNRSLLLRHLRHVTFNTGSFMGLIMVAGMAIFLGVQKALGIGSAAPILRAVASAVIGGIVASLLFSLIFIAGRRGVVAVTVVPEPAPSNG